MPLYDSGKGQQVSYKSKNGTQTELEASVQQNNLGKSIGKSRSGSREIQLYSPSRGILFANQVKKTVHKKLFETLFNR